MSPAESSPTLKTWRQYLHSRVCCDLAEKCAIITCGLPAAAVPAAAVVATAVAVAPEHILYCCTPVHAALGGVILGIATVAKLLITGRILGISGSIK